MRKIIFTLLALCGALFGAWQANALTPSVGLIILQHPPAVVSSGGGPTWNPNSTQAAMVNQGFGGGATFSVTLDATPASPDVILIALYNNSATFEHFTGVTVNGSSATFLYDSAGNSSPTIGGMAALQFWQITGITTPSLTIATTANAGGVQYEGVTVGVLKNLTSSTPTATGYGPSAAQADPQTLVSAITVPSAGFGIVAMATGASGTESPTSSNSTFDSTTNVGGFSQSVFNFHTAAAGSWNPAITGSPSTSFDAFLVAAAWH